VAPDARLRRGTLSVSHCFGTNPDQAADRLNQRSCSSALMDANAEFDPLFGQPHMKAVPVSITPIEPSTTGRRHDSQSLLYRRGNPRSHQLRDRTQK
jgi:hypothetical protein